MGWWDAGPVGRLSNDVGAVVSAAFDWAADELKTALSGCGGDRPDVAPHHSDDTTPELQHKQAQLLDATLDALAPQRPGVTDIYTITYAPFHAQNGFKAESQLMADTMRTRFDGEGHVVQLVNQQLTAETLPWATPANLKAAIEKAAGLMDPQEDILMLALTSHGSPGGQLAASGWPPEAAPLVPQDVKKLLDDAHVRNRLVSVSACFSGSWQQVLKNPDTLVMTASDSSHPSFGCGQYDKPTYFGDAMYSKVLRDETHSFEQAHREVRRLIRDREILSGVRDTGDGFSNPQFYVGTQIKPKLDALAEQLDAVVP